MSKMSRIAPTLSGWTPFKFIWSLIFKIDFFYLGLSSTFITSGKGCKITDKKVGLYKVQYIKTDGTNEIIHQKSTWKLKRHGGTC